MNRKNIIGLLASIVIIFSLFTQFKEGITPLRISNIYSNVMHKNRGLIPKRKEFRPHILLIVADDLGFNDVGYHGSEIRTPNIDRLAMNGIRLENYYVQPICTPTRGELLTGKKQIHTGLYWVLFPPSPSGLPLEHPTIANKLKEAGYSTHMIGKWHLGFHKTDYLPIKRGFDTFFGFLSGHSNYFSHETQYLAMKGIDLMVNDQPADIKRYNGSYSTHLFAEKVDDIIWTYATEKPMFIYLSFQAVHGPLQVPEDYLKQYRHIKNDNRRRYAGMVTCMDESIGHIEETLKKRGIWNETLLIFTTDNGGSPGAGGSNLPLKGGKGSYWEGGIRAVGFVNSNLIGHRIKGNVLKELIDVTDWYPTLANLAGIKLDNNSIDGYNQWQTLQFKSPSKRQEILHYITPSNKSNTQNVAAMRMGSWKILIEKSVNLSSNPTGKKIYLFNTANDPNEYNDLSTTHPDITRVLITKLKEYEKGMVKISEPPGADLQADPKFHNGFWLPWK